MVVTVVGDVKAAEAMPIIEKILRLPSRPQPDEAGTDPAASRENSERRAVLDEQAQPLYLEGYHRPDYRSPDDEVYDAIADLMSQWPHLAALPGFGTRQADRVRLGGLYRLAGK